MGQRLSKDYWVVIPAYNEGKYIARVLEKIKQYSSNIIVIDDGSSDRTVHTALKFTPYVLQHPINLGKGAALRTGCEFAFFNMKATAVILMDADDQHDPAELLSFEAKLLEGHSLLLGTRSLWEMPMMRSLGNRMVSALVVVFFGRYIPDILSGYKAFTKDIFSKILWKNQKYSVELEIATSIARKKIPFETIPITTIYHDFDRGMTILDTIEILLQIIVLRLQL